MNCRAAGLVAVGVLAFGCGDGAASTASGGGGGDATGATAGNGGGAMATGSTSGTGTSDGGSTGDGGATGGGGGTGDGGGTAGLPTLGSLVVLGDSISDGGGQQPFYYDLLKSDLNARYGTVAYQNKAESGSETDALLGQVNALPGSMPGPVAVVITSGGNDFKSALAQIATGTDGPAKQQMANNIDAALDALLVPGRFGAGVEVFVFEGNIYDASDGVGDFGQHSCAIGGGLPTIPSDPYFDAWNAVIATEVAAHGQTDADMHDHFYGHGYASTPNWYASDCTHPSSIGHDELRRLFYLRITGEALP